MLGINIHLEESIGQGSLDRSKLWVDEYLEARPTESEDDGARVTAFLKICHHTKTINQKFIDDHMSKYQLNSHGRATHLIDQVVYGAEFIFSMRRDINSEKETKESAENSIFVDAKTYFDQVTGSGWTNIKPPTQLENVLCTVYSNLKTGQLKKDCSIQQSVKWLADLIKHMKRDKWRPVNIRLLLIPAQLEFRLQEEKIVTRKREMTLNFLRISTKSCNLSKHPTLLKIPPFRNILLQFLELFKSLEIKMAKVHAVNAENSTDPRQVLEEQEEIIQLLSNAINWLLRLRHQVETLDPILNVVQLPVFDMAETVTQQSADYNHRIKVFVFKVNYEEDEMLKSFYKFLGYPPRDAKLPVFSIVSAEKDRLAAIGIELVKFSQEAVCCSNPNFSYQIRLANLSESRFLVDGSIITLSHSSAKKSENAIPSGPPPLIPICPTNDDNSLFARTGPPSKRRRESSNDENITFSYQGPPQKK